LIRVVALRKAAIAGVAGAAAWEIVLRPAILAGVPTFDIVKVLGTLAYPDGPALAWWSVGMAAHALVGICWAVFYAYFFWARFEWPPPLQGLATAIVPALLALGIVSPQMRLMHMQADEVQLTRDLILPSLSAIEIGGLLAGHAIFGLVVGAMYVRPVGYRNGPARIRLARTRQRPRKGALGRPQGAGFIFAAGIEGSYPTIEQGRWRRDEMREMRHYEYWQRDFELAREMGITHLRCGPPLHLAFPGPGEFSWDLVDEPMAELEQFGPEPMVDLCHFGLPAWLGDFQNPEIAAALGDFAAAFAERYPWVRYYTPINEMYVTARMSALDGLWNEQRRDEGAFVTAVFNLVEANTRMSEAILAKRPDAIFIQSESSEFYQACCPEPSIELRASFENERRFLALDLLFAHEVSEEMLGYLRQHGREDDYRRYLKRDVPRRTVLGVDYYQWNEKLVDRNGQLRNLGELFGWSVIAGQYWQRYKKPMMHTETNYSDAAGAPRWLWRQWHNVQLLRRSGVPLIGFTWYSLTDQTDWEIGLRLPNGTVDPVGLFDLNRDPRAVALSYKHLIEMHRDQPEYRECPALKELLS
jgi:beta-glucosidase/6-phospho-beta-glucosidase/beta-galactosidase